MMLRTYCKLTAILATVAVALGCVFLFPATRAWQQQRLAQYLRSQIEELPDEAVPAAVRQLAALRIHALPALAAAIGSQRPAINAAAREQLLAEVGRWESLAEHEASPRLAQLAAALADSVQHYRPEDRRMAADLAERILLWPAAHVRTDQRGLIEDCETILQAASSDRTPTRSIPQAVARLDAPDNTPGHGTAIETIEESATIRPTDVADLRFPERHAGLPNVPPLPPRLSIHAEQAAARDPIPAGERALATVAIPELVQPAALLRPLPRQPEAAADDAPGPQAFELAITTALLSDPSASHEPQQVVPGQLSGLELPDLMRRLYSPREAEVTAVETELERRGLNALQLELARRLASPDVSVRRQLVDDVLTLRGVDPAAWLLWLAEDSDASVRLAALTVMSTGNDLKLLWRVEQMARGDTDLRIIQLADKLRARLDHHGAGSRP